jgi:hypothetical protein
VASLLILGVARRTHVSPVAPLAQVADAEVRAARAAAPAAAATVREETPVEADDEEGAAEASLQGLDAAGLSRLLRGIKTDLPAAPADAEDREEMAAPSTATDEVEMMDEATLLALRTKLERSI